MTILITTRLSAQKFIKPPVDKAITFSEMQTQYNDWKKTVDLKNINGWKYYARWQEEMLMRLNTNGEIADPTDYLNAAIDVVNQKQSQTAQQQTSSWYPAGPNAVPTNLTGYMQN